MKEKDYIDTKETLDRFRRLNKNVITKMLVEDTNSNRGTDTTGAIPYTKEDPAMTNIMETAKTQFGADFSGSDSSMFYYPPQGDSETFDVVLVGRIPKLNNCKFEFKYQGGPQGGCRIWCEPLTVCDDSQNTIKKIYAVFDNWRNEINHDDVKPLSVKNQDV